MKIAVILLVTFSFLLFLLSVFYYLWFNSTIEHFSYSAYVTLSDEVNGFDLNSTALTFGSIVPLGSSSRNILVKNPYPYPVLVSGEVYGSIKSLFLDIPVTIVPSFNETRIPVSVYAALNRNLSFGNYSGNVVFTLRPLR